MGMVQVECRDDQDGQTELVRLYSGAMRLPGAKLLIYDPDETALLTILTDTDTVSVDVYGDHDSESGKVIIVVRP